MTYGSVMVRFALRGRGPILLLVVNLTLFLSVGLLQEKWTSQARGGIYSPAGELQGRVVRNQRYLTNTSVDLHSLSTAADIDIRGMYQKRQMKEYCRRHEHPGGSFLPDNRETLHQFKRHLIFDDERKVIFCFVPKVGCTNMKRLMLYMTGNLPLETLDWPWVDDTIYLEPALKKASLLNANLTDAGIIYRLQTYYKFMIVRSPLERIVSAFRNKLESPLKSPKLLSKFPERVKKKILQMYRPNEFEFWQKSASYSVFNLSVTFEEYVKYITDSRSLDLNEHFQSQIDICHPCLVEYDFYGNFGTYSQDAKALIKKIGANPRYYKDESLHEPSQQTSHFVSQYYSKLDERERLRLLGSWYDEFAFYYTLYPNERDYLHSVLGA